MNDQDLLRICHALADLIDSTNRAEPDPEYRQMFGLDVAIRNADKALNLLSQQLPTTKE